MAHIGKGQLTATPSGARFWKHMREWKRVFWKAERKAAKRQAIVDQLG